MKLMIASDIHGAAGYCRALLDAFDRERADRLLLLGDILYHGPRNDLPDEYAPKQVLAMLNERRERLPPLCPGDILLHGHTHIPAWEPFGEGNLYLNPGSVSIPKNGSARSYMTLEDTTFTWKTLPGEAYHTLTI